MGKEIKSDENSPGYNHQAKLVNDLAKEIKFEDVFNDEKREGVKKVINQHKVLKGLSLVNPLHLQMTSNGHGEFPDGYKLTEKGIQYIIEKLNKGEQKEIENDWEEILFDFIDFYPCILPHELFEWLVENYEIPKKKNGKEDN
ncbi:MAG: hypothetical protein EBV73_07990 [Rhodocyclales bacterium]|nr:hypothetical protein [Rhodocyclales bacterium]